MAMKFKAIDKLMKGILAKKQLKGDLIIDTPPPEDKFKTLILQTLAAIKKPIGLSEISAKIYEKTEKVYALNSISFILYVLNRDHFIKEIISGRNKLYIITDAGRDFLQSQLTTSPNDVTTS